MFAFPLVGEVSIYDEESGCNGIFPCSDSVHKFFAILENLRNRHFRRAGRYLGEGYLAFVLIAMVAQDLNIGHVVRSSHATRNDVVIFQIERAAASATAIIVCFHRRLPEVGLGLCDLGHVVFLYLMGSV